MRRKFFGKLLIALVIIAFAARALLGVAETDGQGGVFLQMNLIPEIRRGLDLVAEIEERLNVTAEQKDKAAVEVWNGEEALEMGLEDYIIHVVAAEMPASFEAEALKAQAVAARTFTVKHMLGEAKCKSGHTVCTDHTCCQAFLTTEQLIKRWGRYFAKYYEKILTAVFETEGEILTCGGEVINALYHSSSGGMTENSDAVFAVALPYLVSVESSGEEKYSDFTDEKTFKEAEFIKKVNEKFPQAEMTGILGQVDIWDRTDSGRVKLVSLGQTVITGQQMRNAFGLHSTNFSFEFKDGEVKIKCIGFGHGVGMSQNGANAMAEQGCGYEAILKHYYTGVELEAVRNKTGKTKGEG